MNIVKGLTTALPIIRQSVTRGYALKSDLKIKWVRPAKVSCIDPRKSGDCAPLPVIDPKQFMFHYQKSKELQEADDRVKDLFRIGNTPRRKAMQIYEEQMIGSVNRHALDFGSVEAKIAKMTAKIRSYQDIMEKFPRNKRLKVKLKEMIEKRRKFLKYVRRWDYRRYEWLLEKLDLIYKDIPEDCIRIERKASLRKLTQIHCDEIRQKKLDEYREKLESQQLDFLERKMKNLQFIRNEQIACQVKVTVTEEEVKEATERYEAMLAKQKKVKDDDNLEIEAN
ncbi:small ribosomal subunit protein uS15m [Culicoides brevitarsis]|uniref:small ribosomal subunit protein uS15m n=1 Tax=Culicoides brevitarsis TaxID=469753 RepID=UPI00307C5DC7